MSRHRGEARHPWGWRTPRGRAALVAVTGASVIVGGVAVASTLVAGSDGVTPAARAPGTSVQGASPDGPRDLSAGRLVIRDPVALRSPARSATVVVRSSSAGAPGVGESLATLTGPTVGASPRAAVPQATGSPQPTAATDPSTRPGSTGSATGSGAGSGTASGSSTGWSSGSGNGSGTGSGTGSGGSGSGGSGSGGSGSGGSGSGTTTPTAWPTASPVQPSASPPPTQEPAEPSHHPLPTQAKGHQKNPPCGPPAQPGPAGCR